MTKTRRTYKREFKLKAVHLLETSCRSAPQLERELGIGGGCLYRWRRKFAEEGENTLRSAQALWPSHRSPSNRAPQRIRHPELAEGSPISGGLPDSPLLLAIKNEDRLRFT